ncbi:MAG: LCP family protein [Acidimicrobiia bacterium]|nr:LCP family protein [Acidimicrobiia bacterium]
MAVAERAQRGRSGVAAAALGAVLPGLGHGYVGHRLRGVLMALPLILVAASVVVLMSMSVTDLLGWLVRPAVLRAILIVNLAIIVWRIAAVADPYRLSGGRHSFGRLLVVVLLAVAVALPHVVIARYTLDTAYVLDEVFVTDDEPIVHTFDPADDVVRDAPFAPGDTAMFEIADPASLPRTVEPRSVRDLVFRAGIGDPDAVAHSMEYRQHRDTSLAALAGVDAEGVDRITILLAGGDAGPGRGGSRTDAIMVATLDTTTGKAAIFGIPRNMTHVPLPDRWADAFVDLEKRLTPWEERKTWTDEDGDGEPDQFVSCRCFPDQINAIYPFTRKWVDTYPDEVDPGLAALRDTLELLLGLEIDYYAMVNMSGFVSVVNALGGIRVYVTGTVSTEVSPARKGEDWIDVTIRPGWRRLNGHQALAYVRERKASSDYTRMRRQRCALKAVAASADPATILTRYSRISRAFASSVKTDINIDYLPTLLSEASSLDFDDVATIGFVPPYYTPELDHRGKPTPDLVRIQAMVRWALSAETTTSFDTGDESECRI